MWFGKMRKVKYGVYYFYAMVLTILLILLYNIHNKLRLYYRGQNGQLQYILE